MTHPATVELHPNFYTMMGRAAGFMPPGMKGFLAAAKMLFEDFLCWFTLPVEVLIRRRIGVRAISLFQLAPLVLGSLAFAFVLRGLSIDPFFSVFFLSAAAFAVYHFRESRAWEASGGAWRHTYSNGEPLPVWDRLAPLFEQAGIDPGRHLTRGKIVRFYEPALCLVVGLLLFLTLSKLLGGFLIGASVALLFKAHIRHQRFVDAVRDRNDAMLTGQFLAEMPNRLKGSGQPPAFVAEVAIRLEGLEEAEPPPAIEEAEEVEEAEEAPVRVKCGGCRATLRVKPGSAGRKGSCPKCRTLLRAPVKVAG